MPRHSQLWEQKGRSLPSIQGLGQERLESKERLKSAQPSRKATREPQRNSRMVGLLSPKTAPPNSCTLFSGQAHFHNSYVIKHERVCP